jgi:hypothetical protein
MRRPRRSLRVVLLTVIALVPGAASAQTTTTTSSVAPTSCCGLAPGVRPIWRRQRNTRGEIDEVFDGYGLLTATDILRLAGW